MRVMSVNVGMPREVDWKGRKVVTGIFKNPVAAKLAVRHLNIDGDRQADLSVHGGPDKAVYAYPSEHYGPWSDQIGREVGAGDLRGKTWTTAGPARRCRPHRRRVPRRDGPARHHATEVAVLQARPSVQRSRHGQILLARWKARDLFRRAGRGRGGARRPDRTHHRGCVADHRGRDVPSRARSESRPGRVETAAGCAVPGGRLENGTGRAVGNLMPRSRRFRSSLVAQVGTRNCCCKRIESSACRSGCSQQWNSSRWSGPGDVRRTRYRCGSSSS